MSRIEDYALIGDTNSAALVSLSGSIDWLCLPRFDSESCFGALLDPEIGGHWKLEPADTDYRSSRAYRSDSLVLETTFETETGSVKVIDCMPLSAEEVFNPPEIAPVDAVLRVVTGIEGSVEMSFELCARFDYGRSVPWTRDLDGVIELVVGPDALDLSGTVDLTIKDDCVRARFEISAGGSAAFICRYRSSENPLRREPEVQDWEGVLEATDRFWTTWSGKCAYDGKWRDQVVRSLITMKALTYSPAGGLVAAATTSLPERIGGHRNWDYRYCWLRDATLALEVLLGNGYQGEAREFHDWLLRAMGGSAAQLQIMYAATGERRLREHELEWLRGYEDSTPVRIGNAAADQFQLDVWGEVMDLFHSARAAGIDPENAWPLQVDMADLVCDRWSEPDDGIWEMRTRRRHYVHSKVMAWVALDRAVKAVTYSDKEGPVERWIQQRDEIRADIMRNGVDRDRGCLKMSYGIKGPDASLLRLPLVGFLPVDDDLMTGTIAAVEEDLLVDGLVHRYHTGGVKDGIGEPEGAFFLCTFWLVCCYVLLGRHDDAQELFGHALSLANDVGLFAEEYDVSLQRQVGNFPQTFSHFSMVMAATALEKGQDAPGLNRGG